jgi:hypothetical protein
MTGEDVKNGKGKGMALVTGGSSGIGFALACRAAEDGRDLLLVARRSEPLNLAAQQLTARYGVKVSTQVADLSTQEGIAVVTEKLRVIYPSIDMVMNCAGIAYGGALHANAINREVEVLRVNIEAPLRISHAFAADFAVKRRGTILNVASLAAFQAGPYLANYYATKAYLLSLTEGLAVEMAPYGVQVSVLCPGTTHTPFHAKAGIADTSLAKGLFGIVMEPHTVSHMAYQAMLGGRVVIVPGLVNQLAALGVRCVPRGVAGWITSKINKKNVHITPRHGTLDSETLR